MLQSLFRPVLRPIMMGVMSVTGSRRAWTPTTLFSAGEAGGVWDFTTLANLYQDSAGTAPCTTVGQTIGLVLDTKNGTPQVGETLVSYDFPSSSGWNFSGSCSVSNNELVFSAAANQHGAYRADSLFSTQRYYEITFEIKSISSGAISVSIGVSNGDTDPKSTVGIHTIRRLSTGADNYLRVYSVGSSTTAVVDNISIRELPGNHLTQSTSTKRPLLGRMPAGGVRNLLTYSDDALGSRWAPSTGDTKVHAALVQSGVTLSSIIPTSASDRKGSYILQSLPSGTCLSLYVKANGYRYVQIYDAGDATLGELVFDAQSGVFSTNSAGKTVSVSSLGGGLYRISVVTTASYGSYGVSVCISGTPGNNYGNYAQTGDGVSGMYLGSCQAEVGSTPTAYQKVVQPYDITESGVADVYCGYFDGVDDCLVSPSIDFTATNKATAFSGVRNTAAQAGMIFESSTDYSAITGTLAAYFLNTGQPKVGASSVGGTVREAVFAVQPIPTSCLFSVIEDISTPSLKIRLTGVDGTAQTSTQGSGNLGNYPIYVGMREGTCIPFKGFMSALCVRGAATDADTIVKMEKWLAAKTPGVALP